MTVQELLVEWRRTYSEWVSAELQLKVAVRQKNSGRIVPLLEEKVRRLQQQCADCQETLSRALATERTSTSRNAGAALAPEHGR